jgi:WD40 repeat protein
VLDPATGRIREVGPGDVVAGPIAFSPRADVLAIPTLKGGLELWNLASGHTQTLIRSSGHAPIAALAFSPDGRRLALALTPPSQPGALLLDTHRPRRRELEAFRR